MAKGNKNKRKHELYMWKQICELKKNEGFMKDIQKAQKDLNKIAGTLSDKERRELRKALLEQMNKFGKKHKTDKFGLAIRAEILPLKESWTKWICDKYKLDYLA